MDKGEGRYSDAEVMSVDNAFKKFAAQERTRNRIFTGLRNCVCEKLSLNPGGIWTNL